MFSRDIGTSKAYSAQELYIISFWFSVFDHANMHAIVDKHIY
jgi:hypothetical protein